MQRVYWRYLLCSHVIPYLKSNFTLRQGYLVFVILSQMLFF